MRIHQCLHLAVVLRRRLNRLAELVQSFLVLLRVEQLLRAVVQLDKGRALLCGLLRGLRDSFHLGLRNGLHLRLGNRLYLRLRHRRHLRLRIGLLRFHGRLRLHFPLQLLFLDSFYRHIRDLYAKGNISSPTRTLLFVFCSLLAVSSLREIVQRNGRRYTDSRRNSNSGLLAYPITFSSLARPTRIRHAIKEPSVKESMACTRQNGDSATRLSGLLFVAMKRTSYCNLQTVL